MQSYAASGAKPCVVFDVRCNLAVANGIECMRNLTLMRSAALCTIQKDSQGTVEGSQTVITKVLALKASLDAIEPILGALEKLTGECSLSRSFKSALSTKRVAAIREEIANVLDDSQCWGGSSKAGLSMQSQRCMAIKPGISTLLDVTRQALSNTTDDVYELAQSYVEEYDMGSLKVAWNSKRGYHLSNKCDPGALPPVFIQCHRQGASTVCTTEAMASLATRHSASVHDIYMITVETHLLHWGSCCMGRRCKRIRRRLSAIFGASFIAMILLSWFHPSSSPSFPSHSLYLSILCITHVYSFTSLSLSLSLTHTHTHTQRYILGLYLSNRNASQGQILDELISKLRRDIAPLLAIADAVALLDMLHSFAHHVSLSDRFVRPEFGTGCQPLTT
jgi:DNA mismatch repair ATPase MutS